LWRKERAALLDELLARLTPAQADALRLRFFADLKFQEIADTMGCSLLTAKNRVRSGLLRLAELAPRELVEHQQYQTPDSDKSARRDAEPLL
jgi:RNA polymerase sigma factor (sigma-70 family)